MITKKLQKIKEWDWYTIKPLINMLPYTHRLRIENYRLLLAECDEGYEVLTIGHRSDVYH